MADPARWRRQSAPIWGATPPSPRVRKYPTLRVISRDPVQVVILNDQVEETWTHFADGRTVFCTGPDHGCWLDHVAVGKPRYGAWLAVKLLKTRTTHLLRLTAIAVSVEPRLREFRGRLRGLGLSLWRIGGHEASEMHCRLELVQHDQAGQLVPAPDVRFCVEHMLEASDRPNGARTGKWRPLSDAHAANGGGHHEQR